MMASPSKVDLEYCQQLPKVELHAHINGSISPSTLQKLAVKTNSSSDKSVKETLNEIHRWRTLVEKRERQTMNGCFQTFKLIHRVIKDVKAVSMVTYDVIKEFASDGVKYLELRSTPRDDATNGMTKRLYIDAVMKGIELCELDGIDTIVKFLPSIDRRMSLEEAGEVVSLALEYQASTDKCVGLDLSGDPQFGDVKALVPLLQRARNHGLKLAIHTAEHQGCNEESRILLGIPPDRIGHGTCLHPEAGGDQDLVDTVVRSNIPIEMCLTSNLIGGAVESPASHHLKYWMNKNHPCVICTDDKGVFSTNLSEEYLLAADTFNLSRHDVWDMSEGAVDCIFGGETIKGLLRTIWAKEKIKLGLGEAGVLNGESL
ncbi:adenosine deaminase-like protein [Strongylocentrotus purpuratus]|uniref:Adenosine deaminase domain-containing protein n=1 Tax=Strongylocentrotus purpuratus TaxID=7668 RepID=A0A7M7N8C2_STRPU|nr:adenosine deaminase-like protein [Strongylocentrotus purpuratus]